MNAGLIKRFGYFFGGFAIGLVLLAFFLNGKKASCDYSPDARVIKNIGTKVFVYSPNALKQVSTLKLDSAQVKQLIHKADIDFSRSQARKKPCGLYLLESSIKRIDYDLIIENCNKKATLLSIKTAN